MDYVVNRIGGSMFISASIAPLFPYGYAHGRRIACDTYGAATGAMSTQYEMNSASYGWWMNGKLYKFNDPDGMVFEGFSANLAPGGLLMFDVNTLAAYRSVPDVVYADDERVVCWRGGLAELAQPGEQAEVVIDLFTHEGDGVWRRSVSRQRHRHHPVEEILRLARGAGLAVAAVLGQRPGAVLDERLDEQVHGKAVFVMRREGSSE